jgi:hypothetical protein
MLRIQMVRRVYVDADDTRRQHYFEEGEEKPAKRGRVRDASYFSPPVTRAYSHLPHTFANPFGSFIAYSRHRLVMILSQRGDCSISL